MLNLNLNTSQNVTKIEKLEIIEIISNFETSFANCMPSKN